MPVNAIVPASLIATLEPREVKLEPAIVSTINSSGGMKEVLGKTRLLLLCARSFVATNALVMPTLPSSERRRTDHERRGVVLSRSLRRKAATFI